MDWATEIAPFEGSSPLDAEVFGWRAAILSELACEGVAVPRSVAVSAHAVLRISREGGEAASLLAQSVNALFGDDEALMVRASPGEPGWGGPAAIRNIGVPDTDEKFAAYIAEFAAVVDEIDQTDLDRASGASVTDRYRDATGHAFAATRTEQLAAIFAAFARDWMRPSARILRTTKGAPEDLGLGILVHAMVYPGHGGGQGDVRGVNPQTGRTSFAGSYVPADGNAGDRDNPLARLPEAAREGLFEAMRAATRAVQDAASVKYVFDGTDVHIIDAAPARRQSRAEIQIAVDLVEANVLNKKGALLRIDPRNLAQHMHPQIEDGTRRDLLGTGIAASPGAAQGPIVFTPEAAHTAHSQGQPAILVRTETTPEDIRGMHSAAGVLTITGGITSHAAVIAQGLGVPCVVGANAMRIDLDARELIVADGRVLAEGTVITLDGAEGAVYDGALPLTQPELSPAFRTLMVWADEVRQMGVRANADTLHEAQTARRFEADGIGLCRSEHMFYSGDRIDVVRQMILAEDTETRAAALATLLPIQRADFVGLFSAMDGAPVTIRLLDPPLHEFLPNRDADIHALADRMGLGEDEVRRRIDALEEFNPMLGKRGVRLAVTMPEIYEMQARAIFEAAGIAAERTGRPVEPEIMIPLVSAVREVEMVKARIEAVADDIAAAAPRPVYKLGVMVETPRAALRSADLGAVSAFLSFGTNDLTQMTYGLSRDDAGRFMREYVNEGVFSEDPFLTLDVEAVGELLLLAARRGREANPDLALGLCGEHGGDPASIRFCKVAGFDYVSCSPFRVPIARLAAAQASLLSDSR